MEEETTPVPLSQLMLAIDDAMGSRNSCRIELLIEHEVRQSKFAMRSFILSEKLVAEPWW